MALAGQRVVLIGGSSGIGLATAKAAAAAGAHLVIAGRSAQRLARARVAIGGHVETYPLNATREREVAAFFRRIGRFHHLSVFVPGATEPTLRKKFAPFLKMEPDVFRILFHNRFWTQCYAARYGAPRMPKGGSIVFVSNTQPRKVIPRYSASCAASGAIEALCRILAIELAPIRVNVVAPGFIATEGTQQIPRHRKRHWDRLVETQPVSRMGRPGEIAEGILFLMGNRFVTGTVLEIDGGYKLT